MSERRVHIVWPESRFVPESQIRTWFSDAIANGDIPADAETDNLESMCDELHFAGNITLHRAWKADL